MSKLEELEKKYKELGEEIERLKNEGKVWKPKEDEDYWVIEPDGDVFGSNWDDCPQERAMYSMGNCFKTEEEAEAMAEKIKIYTELKRLAEEINTEPIDWGNVNQIKHYIMYDEGEKRFEQYMAFEVYGAGNIYSTNKDFLEIAKQRIGEDRLLKLFKE